MKYIIILSLATSLLISTFWGDTNPLEKKGEHKIQQFLIGNWQVENGYVSQIVISKKDNFTYTIIITDESDKDKTESTQRTGWIAKIKNKTFLCIDNGSEGYSHYFVEKVNDKKISALYIYSNDKTKNLSTLDLRKYIEKDLEDDIPRMYQAWLKQ